MTPILRTWIIEPSDAAAGKADRESYSMTKRIAAKRHPAALYLAPFLLLCASFDAAQAQTVALSCRGDPDVTHEFVFDLDVSSVWMDGTTYRNGYPVEISITAGELSVGWHDAPHHFVRSFRINRYAGAIVFWNGSYNLSRTGTCELGSGKPKF